MHVCQENEVQEHHRRDGFEVGNADKIFESTGAAQNRKTQQPMAAYGKDQQMETESGQLKATEEVVKA